MVITSSSLLGADELVTPELERTFRGHRAGVLSLAFSPTIKQLASGVEDGTVHVWHFKPEQRAFRYPGHKGPVHSVQYSPSGRYLASGGGDAIVKLWEPSARGRALVLKNHSRAVRSVAFSADSRLLLTGSDDKTVKIISLHDRRFRGSLQGHSHWVRSATFSPDALMAASGSEDRTVRLWDVQNRECLGILMEAKDAVCAVAFHPDGACLAAGGRDRCLRIWDTRTQDLVQQYAPAHAEGINSVAFHSSGNFVLTSSQDGTLKVWDVREARLLFTVHGHRGRIAQAAFSPDADSSLFASAGMQDRTVMVWRSNLAPYNRVRTTVTAKEADADWPFSSSTSPAPHARPPYIPQRYAYAHTYEMDVPVPAYQRPSPVAGRDQYWETEEREGGQLSAFSRNRGEPQRGEQAETSKAWQQDYVVDYHVEKPSAPPLLAELEEQETREEERARTAVPTAAPASSFPGMHQDSSSQGRVKAQAVSGAGWQRKAREKLGVSGHCEAEEGERDFSPTHLTRTLSLLADRMRTIEEKLEKLSLGPGVGKNDVLNGEDVPTRAVCRQEHSDSRDSNDEVYHVIAE
ncbi:poc1 centriolar protein [Nannochloropsis gaditana]|uniref:Poc1 centriolar protein n=1 Tax=Nannochloropsis gaditana TaxID=72520 RepID=W7UCK8_9STRA|nr:poc1 centriolar protein [Nannochloropsis gaditana]